MQYENLRNAVATIETHEQSADEGLRGLFLFGLTGVQLDQFCADHLDDYEDVIDNSPEFDRLLGMARLLQHDLEGAMEALHRAQQASDKPDPLLFAT